MIPIRGLRAAGLSLLLCIALGCRSTPPPPPQTTSAQPPTPSQSAMQATPAPVPAPPKPLPASNEEAQIDDQTEAAVRGSQTIDFAISSAGKPLQSAALTVRTSRGKIAARGTTDDWGEFHTSLTPGTYKIEIDHQGNKTVQTARIAPDTQEVDLKLDPSPNP